MRTTSNDSLYNSFRSNNTQKATLLLPICSSQFAIPDVRKDGQVLSYVNNTAPRDTKKPVSPQTLPSASRRDHKVQSIQLRRLAHPFRTIGIRMARKLLIQNRQSCNKATATNGGGIPLIAPSVPVSQLIRRNTVEKIVSGIRRQARVQIYRQRAIMVCALVLRIIGVEDLSHSTGCYTVVPYQKAV